MLNQGPKAIMSQEQLKQIDNIHPDNMSQFTMHQFVKVNRILEKMKNKINMLENRIDELESLNKKYVRTNYDLKCQNQQLQIQ